MLTSDFSECFTVYSDFVKTFSEGQSFIVPKLKPCVEFCNQWSKEVVTICWYFKFSYLIYMNEWLSRCLKKLQIFLGVSLISFFWSLNMKLQHVYLFCEPFFYMWGFKHTVVPWKQARCLLISWRWLCWRSLLGLAPRQCWYTHAADE